MKLKVLLTLIESFDAFNLFKKTTAGKGLVILLMAVAQIPAITIFSFNALQMKFEGAVAVPDPVLWLMAFALACSFEFIIYSLAICGLLWASIVFAGASILMSFGTWENLVNISSPAAIWGSLPYMFLAVFPAVVIAIYSHLLHQDYESRDDLKTAETIISKNSSSNILTKTKLFYSVNKENWKASLQDDLTAANKKRQKSQRKGQQLGQGFTNVDELERQIFSEN